MPEENPPAAALDPVATDETCANPRDGAQKRRDPTQPAAVVGLGASAGGVAVLQQFFSEMNPESGLAFVVVMHLSPDFESQLTQVLQQKTAMPVVQVSDPVKVQPNHVYVIPPNHQLRFDDSMLHLTPPQQALGRRVTIDLFFRTLAHAYGQRAVCVILSGTDSDGVIGMKHIHAQGGVTIAQDPEEAEFDSMPATAISTGMVDWVLPIARLAPKLMEFVSNEHAMHLPPEMAEADEADVKVEDAPGGATVSDETRDGDDEDALVEVLKHVREHTGHDFSHYKRATVLRRVARRMQVNSVDSIPHYLDFMRKHTAEARALLHDLLISVTHFFRDQAAFAALEAHIPQLFAGKKQDDELRVWVAGCATGEEAYSVAMLLCEHADKLPSPPSIQVFATDIDEQAIREARDGVYPSTIEADVSQERLRRFFSRDSGRYRVKKDVRDMVLFAAHNLLSDPAFSRLDLAACRNLLIYLNRDAQYRVFDLFHFALRPGGLLFIGGAETGDGAHSLFSPVDTKHRIYVRRSVPRPTWKVPILPAREAGPRRATIDQRAPMLPRMTSANVESAGGQTEASNFSGQERRGTMFGELHLKLLEQYGPPSVVINEAYEIVHLSEHAGRYLTFRAGAPSTNLMDVAHPELRVELRTALFQARQRNENISVPDLRLDVDGTDEAITLHVRPVRPTDSAHGFFVVLFEKKTEPLEPAVARLRAEGDHQELGDELQFLKEQLNATVEQFEASGEELRASNEELQAMNEELRSAAEELETSKEELQSVNEELTTVNHELKDKVEELSRANSDLNNLMSSTDLATIFLDRQLRVQRFTPRIRDIFNLLPADLGRPISDITHKLSYETLIADAEQVLDKLNVVERELRTSDESWFLTRISPYRTIDDRISGVVLTLVDITARKQAEELVSVSEERYRTLFDSMDEGYYLCEMIFDGEGRPTDLRFLESNAAFEKLTGWKGTRGRTIREFLPNIEQEWLDEYGRVALTGQASRREGAAAGLNGRWFDGYAFRVGGEGSGQVAVLFTETTARKQAEEQLRASEERFRNVADNVPQVIWTNDANGEANYFNRRFFDYTGLTDEELRGPGWQAVVHPDDAAWSIARWQQAFAKGEVFDAEYRLRGKDGAYRWFLARNVPLRNNGNVVSWFGSATDIHEFKLAQGTLRETEEKFRLLVEGAPDYAMFLLDLDNNITFWSGGAERVFGWTPQEAIGRKGSIIFVEEDLAKGEDAKEIAIALQEGSAPDRRWHVRKDGSRLWLDGFMRRLNHDDGSLRGFAKIAREATEQKMAEDELRHARDEMEQRVVDRTADLLAANNELTAAMDQRKQLERELLEISEREKRRIGEDLHDMVCQELTATALFLKSASKAVESESPAAAHTLDESAQIVNRNVTLARDLARGLQPAELGTRGLTSGLRDLAAYTHANHGVKCRLKTPRTIRIKDETIVLNLYRIAQEAVTNALKHGAPGDIVICLERVGGEIKLVIEDDGKGIRRRGKSKGLGLHIMGYRANVLGGTLQIESRKPRGTKVTCTVPVKR